MQEISLHVSYVANAGLVLEALGEQIGVDVFCRDDQQLYMDTSGELRRETLEAIESGRLHTLIVTHEHPDHFFLPDVVEAWRSNPQLRIISTEQVARALTEAGIPGGQLVKSLRTEEPFSGLRAIPAGEPEKNVRWIQLGGFRVGFLNSLHEGARYADVQNLTLLVEAAGRRLVVPGDAMARESLFARIAGWSRELDWFFLPFPYVGIRASRQMLAAQLEIRNALVLHQPRPQADVQNWVTNAKRVCAGAQDGLPFPIFPERTGGRWRL